MAARRVVNLTRCHLIFAALLIGSGAFACVAFHHTNRGATEREWEPERQSSGVFSSIKPLLAARTRIPARLPSFIPDAGDPLHPIYSILESAEPTGYSIELAWTEYCQGGNNCHYGTVRGSSSPLDKADGASTPITLAGGIKGSFIAFTCAAFCNDSTVVWTQGGYFYSVSIKAEKMDGLIKVANSAITAGPGLNK